MRNDVTSQAQVSAAAREISAEYAPMAALDEFLVHTTPMPVRVMATTDVRAYERLWFCCHDRSGDLFIVTGLGFYPNLNTAEAYTMVNLRGRLYNVHSHRRMGDNRMNMQVGPISFDVVEAFKDWRLALADNKFNVAYDLHWYDTKRAVFQTTGSSRRPNQVMPAIPSDVTSGYETFGAIEGRVTVDGERFMLDPAAVCGARDHHWGTREGVGGQRHLRNDAGFIGRANWVFPSVAFKDWSINAHDNFYNLGDPRAGSGAYRPEKREVKLRFDPESHLFTEGLITNYADTGEVRELHFRRFGFQVAYLRCGMYGEPNGGTPDGDIWHGQYVGDDVVGGGVYDTTKPEVRIQLRGLDEHHCEVSCGTETTVGMLEITEPIMYERCQKGTGRYKLWQD